MHQIKSWYEFKVLYDRLIIGYKIRNKNIILNFYTKYIKNCHIYIYIYIYIFFFFFFFFSLGKYKFIHILDLFYNINNYV